MKQINSVFFILFFLILCTSSLNAQRQSNIWCFGYGVKIDFNSSMPVVKDDSKMEVFEGCASLSTADGRLLLYTDGRSVWDSLNQICASDLLGEESSTQTFIVPRPGSKTNFYIITVDAEGQPNGLRYTEVDMSLNNGLGGVTAKKNVSLRRTACEKMAVVQHPNGIDYWLITHDIPGKFMAVYKVSENGIAFHSGSGIGVDVPLGTFFISTGAIGYMKVSNKSNRIAMAHSDINIVEIMDFDNSTAELSHVLHIGNFDKKNYNYLYGVEFSEDDRYLYVSGCTTANSDSSYLYQFDLQAGSASEINSSGVILASIPKILTSGGSSSFGALQLAPDHKIYVTKQNSDYLDVIEEPNRKGTACRYVMDGIYLNGKKAAYGLPVFIHPYDTDILSLTFPNIFTPNGDGINDLFHSLVVENVKSCEWSIYNRWGNLLFKTADPHATWDGKFNDEDCPNGTYYWLATYSNFTGKDNSQAGYFQLMR